MAVERRPDAHEFWIGVYSEPALLDLEDIDLVIGDTPTDRPTVKDAKEVLWSLRAGCQGDVRGEGELHGGDQGSRGAREEGQ